MTKYLKIPDRPFLFSVILAFSIPIIARLCWVTFQEWIWFTQYFGDGAGEMMIAIVPNFIPAMIWYLSADISEQTPIAYWCSIVGGTAFLLWAHGTLDLTSSSTAGVGIFIIPFYAVAAIAVSWLVGWFIHSFWNAVRPAGG